MTKKALITGATGAIGPYLIQYLLDKGWQIKAVSRTRPKQDLLPGQVKHLQGDITDPDRMKEVVESVDVIFHLAALLHIENPDPLLEEKYRDINVIGTRILVEAASKAGVRRFIYFSTVKVYGEHRYPPITEQHPCNPRTLYAQTKLEGEEEALGLKDQMDVVILRLSAVYGPDLRGSWHRLVNAIRKGWFIPIGNLKNRRSLVYIQDVAQAAELAATNYAMSGKVYNVVSHESPTLKEIMSSIYKSAGREIPPLHIPGWVAWSGAYILSSLVHLAGKRSPVTPDSINQLIDDETYDSESIRGMGFVPSVNLQEGWKQTLNVIRVRENNLLCQTR